MNFSRSSKNLGGRALQGAAFLAGGRIIVRLFSLLNLVVLARLLTPGDFGIATLAITAVAFFQTISDLKVNSAVIALDTLDQSHLDTAFTLTLLRGLLIALVVFAGAGPIARFMEVPALEPVLQVLSVTVLLDGLKNPAFLIFERNVDFSMEFRRQTIATMVASLSGIAAAVYFRSYWAIVLATVVERLLQLSLTYWRIPYRPRLGLADWRSFIGFGTWLTFQGIMAQLSSMAARVLIGKFLGTGAVGVYAAAQQLASLPTQEMMAPLRRVLFPALSAIKDDPARLRTSYRSAQATILGLALPISLGMTFYAREIILVLFGAKWLAAAVPLQILAPVLAIGTLAAATDSLAMALHRVRPMFVRSAIVLAVAYPAVYLGIQLDGLRGAALGVGVYLLIAIGLNLRFVADMTDDTPFAPFITCYRSMIAALVMLGGLALISPGFDPSRGTFEQLVLLLPCVAAGAAIYGAAHYFLWRLAGRPSGFEENFLFYSGQAFRRIAVRA